MVNWLWVLNEIDNMSNKFDPNQLFSTHNSLNASKFMKPQTLIQQNQFVDTPFLFSDENLVHPCPEEEIHEDSEIFSDISLTYISQLLMDEDDKIDNFHDYSALEAAEKPFYEILGETYPPSESTHSSHSTDSTGPSYVNSSCVSSEGDSISPFYGNLSSVSGDSDDISPYYGNSSGVSGDGDDISSGGVVDSRWPCDSPEYQLPKKIVNSSSSVCLNSTGDNNIERRAYTIGLFERMSAWHFQKGVEEARKFLPSNDKLVIDLESNRFSFPLQSKESDLVEVKPENEEREQLGSLSGLRGKKNPYDDGSNLEEGRSGKQTAISHEETTCSEEFDEVLLSHGGAAPKIISDLREAFQQATIKSSEIGNRKGPGGGKRWVKKQTQKEVVDLRPLLNYCAQMVAADDQKSANELLKQIRQHSSPIGDASQRLAHYFANGIEARLAGNGSEIYNAYRTKRMTAIYFLKAFELYLAACPFKKVSYFFSNETILNVSKMAARVHVVDFGIDFGFQWPSFIQQISARPGGPPKLRITGIDFPQPGFRPSERIEETGHRLADYAQRFKVPFEYKAIACRWEEVRIEDLDIDRDEVLVVNCLYKFHYLADETMMVNSPRDQVLNTVRKMNPVIFIHGIANGSYSAPLFPTRFREVLFYFSAWFDMLDSIVPREIEQRLLFEREIFGQVIFNVLACEGLERIMRPETYKQWQVRMLSAGFVQQPLYEYMVSKARNRMKAIFHKDFIIDEDRQWLLLGWKGRILLAFSSWKPNNLS